MCGIAGYYGNFKPSILERMANAMAHRGPDDQGIWWKRNQQAGIGLAHRRLSIIDLSPAGHQPMVDEDKSLVLVFNGEIYNYQELRQGLEHQGVTFNSKSDTEVLLKLYARYGTEMLSYLNGIFAFALWDQQRQSLFLARDGLGVKPLYYSQTPQGFIFASEIKALLKEESVDRSLDLTAIHYYLTYLWCPAPLTILESVRKLEPGQAMTLASDGQVKEWYFYNLPYQQENSCIRNGDAIEELKFLLAQATERQMVADVEVGAFLSGGLDSSSVVAMATRAMKGGGRLKCFTICPKTSGFRAEGFAEDFPYAQRVARHLDVDLYQVQVGPEMVEDLPKMLYHLDEPQADLAPLNVLYISQLARSHGIKVLLSGAGGDDIFSGYSRHFALMLEYWWNWLPQSLRRGLGLMTNRLPQNNPTGRRLSKVFRYAHQQADQRLVSYFYWIDPEIIKAIYSPEVRLQLQEVEASEPLCQGLKRLPPGVSELNRMLYLEAKYFLPDHNLNYTDKLSMAFGVEVRVPLLDPDLIKFATSLPSKYKQHGRHGKWILKQAMETYLPKDVIYRSKTGFGVPLRHWLQQELRPWVRETLSEGPLKSRGLFDPTGVKKLIEMDRQGMVDASYSIFALICIELWCRIFLDGQLSDATNFPKP